MYKMLLLTLMLLGVSKTIIANPINLLEPFQLNEFLNGTFKNKAWNGTWISDDAFIIQTTEGDVKKVNAVNLKQEPFLEAGIFDAYEQNTISLGPNPNYVLIRYNPKAVFRHSTTAQFAVYDIEKRLYYDIASKKHIQYALWTPSDAAIAYVEDNNVYYLPNPENPLDAIQITTDGIPGVIYNGVPDWVYEEEVLSAGHALWFSPNGKQMVFAAFNDSNVKEFQYYIYGEPSKVENQYPQIVKLRYPKVGTTNPDVVVKHVNLEDPHKIVVTTLHDIIPKEIVTADHMVAGVTWATNTDVVAVTQNRVQNIAAITRCNVISKNCNVETSYTELKGWLGIKPPIYNNIGTKSLLLLSQRENNDTFKHIVLFDTVTKETKRLTFGKRVVLSIQKWDEENDLVYYSSTVEGNSTHQHTYAVNVQTLHNECLTCALQTPEGLCKVAVTHFSKRLGYTTIVCSGPGPILIQIQNLKTNVALVWEENNILRDQLRNKLRPVIKDIDVNLENGFIARARLWLPPSLNQELDEKYPMIVDVYGGPNTNRIVDSFTTGIVNYFTTNRNYIYVQIDGRGAGRNGDNLMFQMYRKMGTVEIEDQITVAKYIKNNFAFVDDKNIGIWGWSYGGFATIWTLIKDTDNIFKFGLSVAPVTNFIYYDTIYTERYMGLPTNEDNIQGYNNTDVTKKVESLRNKKLFLIHGNADDNVHYQQSMLFAKALEEADIMFYQHSYPDENHSLGGVSRHLYHTIDRFFADNLNRTKLARVIDI